MLGSQTWFTAAAVPTILIGGFIATRKRLAYQWREELMDPDGTSYPATTTADMEFFRRVAPASSVAAAETSGTTSPPVYNDAYGVELSHSENIGLSVRSAVVSLETAHVLLNEVRRWSASLGHSFDGRRVAAIEDQAAKEMADVRAQEKDGGSTGNPNLQSSSAARTTANFLQTALNFSFLRDTLVISDHAEDTQSMRAPWGNGDSIRFDEMPASLRYLIRRAQDTYDGIGRLRHVYIEYSPQGCFYRVPRPPKAYDGHDYVIVPLRRDGANTVVTLSPVLRSKVSYLKEVALHSWTNRDVDALIPPGFGLRVYGTARYEWGWGIRPGASWFGSRLNPLHPQQQPTAMPSSLWHLFQRSIGTLTSYRFEKNEGAGSRETCTATTATGTRNSTTSDAALIVLHFEGPRSSKKQRSLLLQPELFIFGRPPTAEAFDKWVENRPTADGVQEEGLFFFLVRNYLDMLVVS